jgi:hypothetical protein
VLIARDHAGAVKKLNLKSPASSFRRDNSREISHSMIRISITRAAFEPLHRRGGAGFRNDRHQHLGL